MQNMNQQTKIAVFLLAAIALIALPLVVAPFGQGWVRIMATALLYVMLALGLNIVVGYAGLLDLGYVAFYAVGAYLYALLSSPHLSDNFEWIKAAFPNGLHTPVWVIVPLAAALAGLAGVILGAPSGITSQTEACRPCWNVFLNQSKVSVRCGEASRPNRFIESMLSRPRGPLVMLIGCSRLFMNTRMISPKPKVTMAR